MFITLIALIVIIVVVIMFLRLAGKKKAQGDDLGDTGKMRNE